uniref:Integrase zinc-binding domain-containing protein n=1 Tax=Acrobeloides nanus TaxID=290746 RepID=A0A914DMH8_9BILA
MAEHVKALHAKNNVTLSMIREKYWIPQGARNVMNAIKSCPVCKKFDAVPFRLPKMGKLPLERSTRTRPFEYTGVDMFGPLRIKNQDGSKGKIWGIIFTCMTTRLTYIDVVSDASAFT